MEEYFAAFRKLYPGLRKSDLKGWRLTKTRYAQSEKYPVTDLHNPCPNLYVCASGIAKFGTNEAPLNRMDRVVGLANVICSEIAGEVHAKSDVTPLPTKNGSREFESI